MAGRPDDNEEKSGLTPCLPVSSYDDLTIENNIMTLYLTLPDWYLDEMNWQINDRLISILHNMLDRDTGISGIDVRAWSEQSYRRLSSFIPSENHLSEKPYEPEPVKADEQLDWPGQPGGYGQGQYAGSLSGKSIFLSQSHGWYRHDTLGWITQRVNTNDIVEDFICAEAINQYLVQYLFNAGAGVYTCRERDMNTDETIIDNNDSGFEDSGSWQIQTASSGVYDSDFLRHPVTQLDHAWATWSFTPSEPGHYEVYIWYRGNSDASTETAITVHHNGGDTLIIQNQQRDGWTWKSIGNYYFSPADPETSRQVSISSEGSDPAKYVIADAVRFGGGMGSLPDPDLSNRPRWEESGKYYAQFMGCNTCGTSTVSSMPKYAAWESESWEDSIYFSWHTNAPDPGTGTSSYIYISNPVANSDGLQDWIHEEIINDIRAGYDSGWMDRGQRSADFGEVNPGNNSEMPALLIELAFHDTPGDALYLKDPKFRMLAARAIYQGMEKFYAWKDNRTVSLLPEPPENLMVQNSGSGMVQLSWSSPPANTGDDLLGDPATGYRVYTSSNGYGFDNGISTAETSLELGPYQPGEQIYFKVTATNDGGESFPTPVLGAMVPYPGDISALLLVDAFDRMDRYAMVPQYESSSLGTVLRMFLSRMNPFNTVITHGDAARNFPGGYDSCVNEVVKEGMIDLLEYSAVDWIAGEDSRVDETVSDDEQMELMNYLDNGGNLFISGAEIAWDLDAYGSSSDIQFCHDYLKISYSVDDAGTDTINGVTGSIFEDLDTILFDYDSYEIYAAEYPDGVAAVNGGNSAMVYDGTGYSSVVTFDGEFNVVTMGIPFETILFESDRDAVMDRILEFLVPDSVCIHDGDPDMSGTITAADAQLAFQIVLGLHEPTTMEFCGADCDGDGSVTAGDAQDIFFVVLGIQPGCS